VNDEASRGDSSTIFGLNRTVIDSSTNTQGPFRFDLTLAYSNRLESIRDIQISTDDPSLMAITFDRRIEIYDVNLATGTTYME